MVSVPSILLTIFLLELTVRFVLPVSDRPRLTYDTESQILHMVPNQRGTYVLGAWGEVTQAEFHVNNAGWNSGREYTEEKSDAVTRIAVIGDSYTEALQVPYSENYAAILDQQLGDRVEVYNFGVSGAPFSQYLHVMRMVARVYQPDIIIVNVVQNDFAESFATDVWLPHFLQFRLTEGEIEEIAPTEPYFSPQNQVLRRFAIVRYLRFNLAIESVDGIWRRLGLKDTEISEDASGLNALDQTVGVNFVDDRERMTALIDYIFSQALDLATEHNFELLLQLEAPQSLYYGEGSQEEVEASLVFQNNLIVRNLAEDYEIELHEVSDVLLPHHRQTGEYVDFFPNDSHWNATSHRLIGEALAKRIQSLGWVE